MKNSGLDFLNSTCWRAFALATLLLVFGGSVTLGQQPSAVIRASNEPLPLRGASAPPEPESGSISLQVQMALSALAARVNGVVLSEFHGDVPVSIPIAHSSHSTYSVRRQPFALRPSAKGAVAFAFDTDVDGTVHYKWTPFDQEHNSFRAAATLSGELHPEIDTRWHVQPNLSMEVDVHHASVDFIQRISVRELLIDRINDAMPLLCKRAEAEINAQLGFHDRVAAYWTQAYQTFQLSSDPEAYIQVTPTAVRIKQVTCGADGILSAGISLDCSARLIVGYKPSDQTPAPLPEPESVAALAPTFRLDVPVTAPLTEIATYLRNHVRGETHELGSDRPVYKH